MRSIFRSAPKDVKRLPAVFVDALVIDNASLYVSFDICQYITEWLPPVRAEAVPLAALTVRQALFGFEPPPKDFESQLRGPGFNLLRPARIGEQARPGAALFRPLRQVIESINQAFTAQLDLERRGGRTPEGVCVRITISRHGLKSIS